MKFQRILALVLVCGLVLSGCGTAILGSGTLSIDANEVSKLEITNGLLNGSTFTVQDRDAISKLIGYINSYTLEDGETPANGWHFHIRMVGSGGDEVYECTIVDENQFTSGGSTYNVSAGGLLHYVEKLECDTLTDNQLIDRLLTGNELADLRITDENGNISLDKLLKLTDQCPTLFELLGRSSAIQSITSYGLEAIQENLSGTNTVLKERAESLAEILKEYFPDLEAQIDKILENNKK